MGFGNELRNTLLEHLNHDERLVSFCERITDDTLNRKVTEEILDFIADEDYNSLGNLLKTEMARDCFLVNMAFTEYPELFNRRILIPASDTFLEMALCMLASLRIHDHEGFYVLADGVRYSLDGENRLSDVSMFDLRYMEGVRLVYGEDLWSFEVSLLGVSKKNDRELFMPYIVEDAVGYGIEGIRKSRLLDSLLDSIDHSTETKNPIMDDEEFEFYNADTDSLNLHAEEDYLEVRCAYLGEKNE